MPTYEFRCPADHASQLRFSMAEVPGSVDCPECSIRARRVYRAPHLGRGGAPGYAAAAAAEKSAHEPDVVTSVPGAGRPAGGHSHGSSGYTTNPLHHKLPRP